MAERPVFVPRCEGSLLVDEVPVAFTWHRGMAPSQKRKNIAALHSMAAQRGLAPLLEISSKSESELGRRLSAFRLTCDVEGREATVECVFQGSKVFEHGGPFHDLYWMDSRIARNDVRLKESGRLIGFRMGGKDYPLSPTTVFYDWLYFNALLPHQKWLTRLHQCAGFTDIEFNPERSLNCQARSCAIFVSLHKRGLLNRAEQSFDVFRTMMQSASI
jgi:hypothetical protein